MRLWKESASDSVTVQHKAHPSQTAGLPISSEEHNWLKGERRQKEGQISIVKDVGVPISTSKSIGKKNSRAQLIKSLEVKPIAQFCRYLPWVVVVEAADGQRTVGQYAVVGDVDDRRSELYVFAESLAGGDVEGGMRWQIIPLVRADEIAAGIGGAGSAVGEA